MGATWEVHVSDTNLRPVLLVIKETHLSIEEVGTPLKKERGREKTAMRTAHGKKSSLATGGNLVRKTFTL